MAGLGEAADIPYLSYEDGRGHPPHPMQDLDGVVAPMALQPFVHLALGHVNFVIEYLDQPPQ